MSEDVSVKSMVNVQNDDTSAEKTASFNSNTDYFTSSAAKFLSSWIASCSRRKSILKARKSEKEFKDPLVDHVENSHIGKTSHETESDDNEEPLRANFLLSKREPVKAAIIYVFSKWQMHFYYFWRTVKQFSEWTRELWVSSFA